jgi:hypothetical protein
MTANFVFRMAIGLISIPFFPLSMSFRVYHLICHPVAKRNPYSLFLDPGFGSTPLTAGRRDDITFAGMTKKDMG